MATKFPVDRGDAPSGSSRLERLKEVFPEAFDGDRLDLARLGGLVGEGAPAPAYGLTWAGREEAKALVHAPSRSTLIPDREASEAFETAQHVVIEGDNLETLKALMRAYHGTAKMIFIDPPYNTGHQFLYPDDFRDGVGAYLRWTGQVDEAGQALVARPEVDGRHHSRWLSMMYPRLVLARELLREDGAIFVTIDDHEVHHLKMLMNAIFGEAQFVAHIAWQKRYTRSNNTDNFTSVIDHVLLYARSEAFQVNLLARPAEANARFRNPDDDPRGPWKATPFLNQVPPEKRPNLAYPITNPNTGETTSPTRKAWRVERAAFDRLQSEGRLWWGKDGTKAVPDIKTYLSEVRQGMTPINFWDHGYAGHTDQANREVKAIFGAKIFDTPKPVQLIRRMLEHVTSPDEDALVVDFFAGSGTTGEAVLAQNAADGGRRRALLVQLPEPTGMEDYPTIAHMTRARMAHAIGRYGQEGEGFRAFRLGARSLPAWEEEAHDDPGALADALEAHAAARATDRDPLERVVETMLEVGLPLDAPIERVEIHGAAAWSVAGGRLLACLEVSPTPTALDALVAAAREHLLLGEVVFEGQDGLRVQVARTLEARGAALRTV